MSKISYQEKFMSLEEALNDAKAKSVELKTQLAVIQKGRLYYSDANTTQMEKEVLHAVFDKGKKVKL